ncbi:MAG: sulfotransferase [Gammaproteobacteria bacterium]
MKTHHSRHPRAQPSLEEALRAHRANELAQAEQRYKALLEREPQNPQALHYFGLLLHQRGRLEEARQHLEAAERLAPARPDFLLNHARVLGEQGCMATAKIRLDHLLALEPDSPLAIRELANNLAAGDEYEAACALLESWLARHPTEYTVWLLLGDLRQQTETPELALQAWERVQQNSAGATRLAALFKICALQLRQADTTSAAETFRRALACGGTTADEHHRLAAAAGQFGDFANLRREAKAAVNADPHCYTAWYQLTLAPDDHREETAQAMRTAVVGAGADPQAWVLHLALGRVLEKLGRYDDAFAACTEANRRRARVFSLDYGEEARYFDNVRKYLNADFVRRPPFSHTADLRPIFIVGMPRSGTTLIEAIVGAHPEVTTGGEMQFLTTWLRRNTGSLPDAEVPAWLAHADDPTLARLTADWQSFLERASAGRKRITDKLPINFFLLGLIALCFPDAAVVHVRRDARDTCISCYTTALAGRGLPAELRDLGAYYRKYETLMDHWRKLLGAERIVEVEYERLVRTPEPTIRRLLGEIDLDWHQDCLAFHESRRPVATASLHQVRQPIYRGSIGRWRHFEAHLLPLLEALEGTGRQ